MGPREAVAQLEPGLAEVRDGGSAGQVATLKVVEFYWGIGD